MFECSCSHKYRHITGSEAHMDHTHCIHMES